MSRYIFNDFPIKYICHPPYTHLLYTFDIFCTLVISSFSFAQQEDSEEEALARMLAKNVTPPEYSGPHWRLGYICKDLLRYSWTQNRNCRYYHRYHGHYYY